MFKNLIIIFSLLSFQAKAQQTFTSEVKIFYNFLENTSETTSDYLKFEFYKPSSVIGEHGKLKIYNYDYLINNLDIIYVGQKKDKTEIVTTYYINNPGATFNVFTITKFINGNKFQKKYNYVFSLTKVLNSGTTIAGISYLIIE